MKAIKDIYYIVFEARVKGSVLMRTDSLNTKFPGSLYVRNTEWSKKNLLVIKIVPIVNMFKQTSFLFATMILLQFGFT